MFLVVDGALWQGSPARSARFDELVDLEGDGSWRGRVRGELHIAVAADHIRIQGELRGTIPRECHLCLGHYLEDVSATVIDLCEVGGEPGGEAWFDDDAEVWRVGLGGRIDVTEIIRQAVLLALPTRADCGECRGREERREAEPDGGTVDPRLAVLRRLLEPEVTDGGPEETNQ